MRKRTRKHRGTAGKMVGGFLAFFCLILLTAGMFWAIQGYVFYQKAVKEKPLAQAVEEHSGLLLNRCLICTKKRCLLLRITGITHITG